MPALRYQRGERLEQVAREIGRVGRRRLAGGCLERSVAGEDGETVGQQSAIRDNGDGSPDAPVPVTAELRTPIASRCARRNSGSAGCSSPGRNMMSNSEGWVSLKSI